MPTDCHFGEAGTPVGSRKPLAPSAAGHMEAQMLGMRPRSSRKNPRTLGDLHSLDPPWFLYRTFGGF